MTCAVILAVTGTGYAVAQPQQETSEQTAGGFDFARDNAAFEVIYPRVGPRLRESLSRVAMDGTIVLRVSALMETSWFDATAPYHPTAVGIHSDLGRRPASEATHENINIAMLYSSYRALNSLMPQYKKDWREMMTSVGLDPDDDSTDLSTPVGLGNVAGRTVMAKRERDGMNQLGDEGGRKYHRQPYADYTGYKPVNTALELRNPSRWQPELVTGGSGLFEAQHFVTPQMAVTKPYSFEDPKEFLLPPPTASNHRNREAYKKQADEILHASANLNDERKLKAEFFNDKLVFNSAYPDLTGGSGNLLDFVQQAATVHIASFDALLAAWYNKVKHDAPRPFTAIRHVYGDKKVTAWGGPGLGKVTDMPADQWRSYLQTGDHAEYPSGTTSFCGAQTQVGKRWMGTDKTDVHITFPKGSSYIEPNVTPAEDVTLKWSSWSDLAEDCVKSRTWAGVHFPAAARAGRTIGTEIGDRAYEFVQSHIKGKPVGSHR